jgi:TonB family protein
MAKKLLLIEYEPRYIDKVRTCARSDFEVQVARDGEEALALFDTSRPDVVLISAVLPKSRPNDVIREIRRRGGALAPPILILMSGYQGSNPKADAQKIGAFDILEKPFSEDTFRSLVFDALESTDPGNQTLRLDRGQGTLTSSDIFSDVLEDLQPEPSARSTPERKPVRAIPDLDSVLGGASPAPARPSPPAQPAAASAIDKRLEETLSGVLSPARRSAPARAPEATKPTEPTRPMPAPARPASRQASDRAVDDMISQTLSGFEKPAARARPPAPPPAAPPVRPEPARPERAESTPGRFGQYEIMEKIAVGGMAEVYKARMSGVDGFQKIVAIKKILPHMASSEDFLTMFADEAKLAAQLNHPNIIHIYDLGKVERSYYIAMEYVDGRDLRSILKSGAEHGLPLPPELALFIASKLAAALDYAHRRKDFDGHDLSLVHRDVSPQNVLISYEGDIKLCDFGIAKAATKSSQTQAGALKGKLQYMSPEQASGKSIDRRSDIFSLGSVLYEMLTGQKLFGGDSDLTVLDQVRSARVPPPSEKDPDIPKRVDNIVLRALARNPDERYQNASDIQRDLESVLYTFSPAPGSADVAIYLHHLQAEEKASGREAEHAIDRAFAPTSEAPAPPAKRKKAKGTVVQRRTGATSRPVPPPKEEPAGAAEPAAAGAAVDTKSGVFGAYSSGRVSKEKKARKPLLAGIGAAAVVLVVVAVLVSRKRGPTPGPAAPQKTTAPAPAVATTTAPPVTSVSGATSSASTTFTEKSIEDEVKRQLAQRQKDLQQKNGAAGRPAGNGTPAAAGTPTAAQTAGAPVAQKPVTVSPPAPVPVAMPSAATPAPAPLPIPQRISSPAPAAPPPAPAVRKGELVGPGPGVIEPELASRLNVSYPLAARQERVSGKVIILALIDENGRVESARVQKGVASKTGVNEAIRDAVTKARFRPATKDGVPVKMYKAIPVEVNP